MTHVIDFTEQFSLDMRVKGYKEAISKGFTEVAEDKEIMLNKISARAIMMHAYGKTYEMHMMAPQDLIKDKYINVINEDNEHFFKDFLIRVASDINAEDGAIIITPYGQILGCSICLHEIDPDKDLELEERIASLSGVGTGGRALLRWSAQPNVIACYQLSERGNVYEYEDGKRTYMYSPEDETGKI
jgi:hypothetical protein